MAPVIDTYFEQHMQIFTNKSRQEVHTLPVTKPVITRQGDKNKMPAEGSVSDLALLEQLKRAKGSAV